MHKHMCTHTVTHIGVLLHTAYRPIGLSMPHQVSQNQQGHSTFIALHPHHMCKLCRSGMCLYIYVCTSVSTCICLCNWCWNGISMSMCASKHVCKHNHTCMNMCVYTRIYIYIQLTLLVFTCIPKQQPSICASVCKHTCMYVCMYGYLYAGVW